MTPGPPHSCFIHLRHMLPRSSPMRSGRRYCSRVRTVLQRCQSLTRFYPASFSCYNMSHASPSSPDADRTSVATASSATSSPAASPSSSLPSSSDDPLGFVWDLKANPCFRSSLMWGIGLGTAMGVHAFTRHKLPYKASDTAVKTFFVVSSLSWLWCRHQARKEKELFDAVINMEISARRGRRTAADNTSTAAQPQSADLAPATSST